MAVQPAQAVTVKVCTDLSGSGCSCSVTATNIGYGSVAVDQLVAHQDNTGQISLTCNAAGQTLISQLGSVLLSVGYQVSLGPGASRSLVNGAYSIPYKIYQDASHTIEWGTIAENKAYTGLLQLSASVSILGLLTLNFSSNTAPLTTYARLLPSGGPLGSGAYSDTVNVTINY